MKNYFTQIPNEVAVSNIPDGLCRLLLYCYGNADTFRYSVAHLMDALNKDRRTTQRYVRELVSGSVLIPTAPHMTKFGATPNYIFNADKVLKFLSTKEPRQLRSENEAATNAATQPASEAATEPATPHHANNNNKQDQKPIITNQNKKSISGFEIGQLLQIRLDKLKKDFDAGKIGKSLYQDLVDGELKEVGLKK